MKITSSSRWQFLLLLIIILSLLAYPAAGCKTPPPSSPQPVPSIPQNSLTSNTSIPGLVPLINDTWKYTVYFPQDWYIENNVFYNDRGILDFHAPPPYHGMISVEVYDLEKIEFEANIDLVAQQQINEAKEMWGEIVLKDSTRLSDNWNWYYAFDGVLWNLDFHVMTYLKQTDKLLYKLKIQLVEDEFDDAQLSNLEQIPEAFEFYAD